MEQRFFDDEAVAAAYDSSSAEMFAADVVEPTVDFLAELAGRGDALELGIGTGRIGLPLSQRGVRVHGVDLSEPMLDQLRAKPGAEAITLTVGNFATTRVSGSFKLVFLLYNAITAFTTQDEQVDAFLNAASHLDAGGYLVTEVWVPALRSLPPGETMRPFRLTSSHLAFDQYDFVDQRCDSHHYFMHGDRMEHRVSEHRFLWPSELDLMARMAGLELHERWSDWMRSPFTSDSRNHISVWRRPEQALAAGSRG